MRMRMKDDERWYLAALQAGLAPPEALEERGGNRGRLEHLLRVWKLRRWYQYPHAGDPLSGALTKTGRRIDPGVAYEPPVDRDDGDYRFQDGLYDAPESIWPPVIEGGPVDMETLSGPDGPTLPEGE